MTVGASVGTVGLVNTTGVCLCVSQRKGPQDSGHIYSIIALQLACISPRHRRDTKDS